MAEQKQINRTTRKPMKKEKQMIIIKHGKITKQIIKYISRKNK